MNCWTYRNKLSWKYLCGQNSKCVAFTYEHARLSCTLHSSKAAGVNVKVGKKSGERKDDFILSLAQISMCTEKIRRMRCKREPKCRHVNCLRDAWNYIFWKISGWSFTVKFVFPSFKRKIGYDVGFAKDKYGCNSNKCECEHFEQTVIGKRFLGWF